MAGWKQDIRVAKGAWVGAVPAGSNGRVGINYAYVRDFPDNACLWLTGVFARGFEAVPDALKMSRKVLKKGPIPT